MGAHHPAPHGRPAPVPAIEHQPDRLAFIGEGLVRGHAVSAFEGGSVMEPAFPGQVLDGPFGGLRGDRSGVPGEGCGEQVRAWEHRLAFGEMGDCPFQAFPGLPSIRCTGDFPACILAPGHGFGRKGPRVEPDAGGLLLPEPPQRRLVHVPLAGPGHERRPLGQALILRRNAPFGHGRLDLRPPGRERLDHLAGNARDLEPPVRVGLLDPVAEPAHLSRHPARYYGRVLLKGFGGHWRLGLGDLMSDLVTDGGPASTRSTFACPGLVRPGFSRRSSLCQGPLPGIRHGCGGVGMVWR